MVKMVKHSFRSPNFFANFDSEFGEGSDKKVCTQVRTGDAAYRTPFRHNGELYFLVEDRQQVLIPKCERLDDMLAAFDRVFAGNYRVPRAARAAVGSSAGLLAGLLRNDLARRNARQ